MEADVKTIEAKAPNESRIQIIQYHPMICAVWAM